MPTNLDRLLYICDLQAVLHVVHQLVQCLADCRFQCSRKPGIAINLINQGFYFLQNIKTFIKI